MRLMTTTMAMAGVFALLAGCNRASTPAEVRHDVTEASQDAATRLADAQAVAAKDVRKEGAALDKTVESASTRVADSARHVADAEAEGSYDVAIAKATAALTAAAPAFATHSGGPDPGAIGLLLTCFRGGDDVSVAWDACAVTFATADQLIVGLASMHRMAGEAG